ncbi:helix-turn-helix transcriptional regulator [Agrobacterium tumefaciens]|jgi:transcriptional regulator with XRE-family HTH domain|nr:helix-turn-helix transcriptional regulator [Agrobacterium tumefaciens]
MAKHVREMTPEEVIIAEDALMDFQFAVIDAMREKKISKAELADKLGISRARVSQMLSSEANPTLKVVGRALAALDLEAKYVRKAKMQALNTPAKGYDWDEVSRHWEIDFAEIRPKQQAWHNDNKKRYDFTPSNTIRKAA